MTKGILLSTITLAATALTASANVVFTDSFTYTDGALVGQGPWVQNSTVATNPLQILGAEIANMTTGQDAYANFPASIVGTDGAFAYYALTLSVSAATATGDYFAHFTNGLTNPAAFTARLAARSSGTGFQLGYSESTNGGTTYGTTDLTFGTDYQVVVRYGFISGTLNDTGAVYVTPAGIPFDPIEANNTPYVIDAFGGTTAEINTFTGFQFRQGGATTFPTVSSIDDLAVATTFGEVIPEPTAALAALWGGSLLLLRRRRK